MVVSWKAKPRTCMYFDSESDYILSLDESGTSDMLDEFKYSNTGLRWFVLCGVILDLQELNHFKEELIKIKNKYWINGYYRKKRVILHSRDIRLKNGPFSPKIIDYEMFKLDLYELIEKTDFKILTSVIDKLEHQKAYGIYCKDPYSLCVEFIMERYAFFLKDGNFKGELLLEKRTAKKDEQVLNEIVEITNNGTRYVRNQMFKCINAAHFSQKLTGDKKKSYFTLELADIVAYEISLFVKHDIRTELFDILESKFISYPDYKGKGLKIFPILSER